MKQFKVFLLKEFRESWRNFKFLWIPLVFLSLGVSDPLVNYYMKDIMEAVGNLPEGFEIMMPELRPADLLVASTSQFQTIGIVVLIAALVGMISKERQNGTATLIYARPISYVALFLSKWTVAMLIGLLSLIAGYAGSMYYTAILYGSVEWGRFLGMVGLYSLWIAALLAVTLMLSAAFRTAVAATLAIMIGPIGLLIDSLIGGFWTVTPWKLGHYATVYVTSGAVSSSLWYTVGLTLLILLSSLVLGSYLTQQNAPKANIS